MISGEQVAQEGARRRRIADGPHCRITGLVRWSDNGDGLTLWSHVTDDPLAVVLGPEYFGLHEDRRGGGVLRHDRIEVTASADGPAPEHATLVVTGLSPVTVEVLRGGSALQAKPGKKAAP